MPAPTSDTLLAELTRLKLLSDEAASRVGGTVRSRPLPPDQFARVLTDAGLTRFQAQAAVVGQAKKLLFGQYVLLDRIGDGGMGVVYKARHVRLGRIDAVKVLRTDKVGSRTLAKRFLREIQLTSSLEHSHIVHAYDAGIVGGRLYLATEFIDGTDLATAVRTSGPLSVGEACLVMYQTAQALRHIHEKGLVHRDLKPSNLLRAKGTGAVKVLDLGLSGFNRVVVDPGTGATLTRDGVLLGTPDYMAPEQAQDPHNVDIRADLYSLGCTFYFLLTGRPPFEGSQVDKLFKHSFAPPPELVLPNNAVPRELAELVAKLMAKKPEDRFQTPQTLIDALLELRPGAGGARPYATPVITPPPLDTLDASQFEHLLSRDGTQPLGRLTSTMRRPPLGIQRHWVMVAALALLFGVGFLATALYFSGGR